MSESRAYGRPISALNMAELLSPLGFQIYPIQQSAGGSQAPLSPNLLLPYGTVSGQVLIWTGYTWIGAIASFASGVPYVSGAAAGTAQNNAALLTTQKTILVSGAGSGVQINNSPTGLAWEIWNRTGSGVNIYPMNNANAQFEQFGINTAIYLNNNDKITVTYLTATQAYVG